MPNDDRQFRAYDIEVAERMSSLETTVHDTVIPLLRRIEENCAKRCATPPTEPTPPTAPSISSSAWFWGKVAGGVAAAFATMTAIGVAAINKAPEVIAAVSAFFHPPKQP